MVKRILNAVFLSLHSLNKIRYPNPQPAESPAIAEPKESVPFIKSCVIKTEPAQPGIRPKRAVKRGCKILPDKSKEESFSSPTKFIEKLIASIAINTKTVIFMV